MEKNTPIAEEYRQAMDSLRFTDGAKARMAEKLLAGEARKPGRVRVRPLRTALIAACLCLALAGAALAAAAAVRLFHVDRRHENGITWMDGGIAIYPCESLSGEIRAEAGELHRKGFDSWQEAEDFIGVDLMNNPLLEGAEPVPKGVIIHDSSTGDISASTVVTMLQDLDQIWTESEFMIGNVRGRLTSRLYTDSGTYPWEDGEEDTRSVVGHKFNEKLYEVTWETYTAPSGLEAQVALLHEVSGINKGAWKYCAAFSLNGIPTEIDVFWNGYQGEDGRQYASEAEREAAREAAREEAGAQAREVLYQVLDAFVLE